jgi:D-proline reductase (dithiol) PrdB
MAMRRMSRRCIPFTPFEGRLEDSIVALVSNAGVYHRGQEPFNLEGDTTLRIIPGDARAEDLSIAHAHYDHSDADKDINCVFPIDRLKELAGKGIIRGLAERHIGLGWSLDLKTIYEETAPQVGDLIERSDADLVLLTGG